MASTAMMNNVKENSPNVNIMPPLVFFLCLVFGGVLELFAQVEFPLLSMPLCMAAGLIIGGSGFALMMAAHEKFKKIGTNVPTNLPATTLVVLGAYRYSRNPMYLGASAFFIGMGLVAGSFWMVAAYIPLGLYLSLYVIPREEAYMEQRFGDEYRAYCKNVRRWL